MNRVFLSGKVRDRIDVAYTPRGDRIVTFPLWVEEGDFMIEVVAVEGRGGRDPKERAGQEVSVAGALWKGAGHSRGALKVKAQNIYWMED